MKPHTPFFHAWLPRLAPMGCRTAQVLRQVRAYTLNQLEERFGHCLPQNLLPKAKKKTNSRDRIYTRPRTFWSMLWQGFNPLSSGREVVRQMQALFQLQDGPEVSENDGGYCRAKARLPLNEFPRALTASAQAADQLLVASSLLQGRSIKVVDGSTLTLNDTPKNRRAYPALQCPEPNFPMLRVVVLFSLLSGAILGVASGSLRTGELELVYALLSQLVPKDILIGDRGYGNYVLLALLEHLQLKVDFIGRSKRGADGRRRLKRLGQNDWLVLWQKGSSPSRWLPKALWRALAPQITVRIVRGSCPVKGFRVREVTLVTTLLDPAAYPAQEILQAYLRRWRLEMCLNDLKTTLELDQLRGRSPAMIQKELYARLIDHNLVRYVMAQAAGEHHVPLERLSFKGTLDGLRQFTQAMSQARSKAKRRQLWDKLLETLAADQVPDRPGRREPRAVKRVKNKYPRLSVPRHLFRDKVKREVRRTNARLRKLALK
jgi:Transposase DDE domain